MKFAIAPYSLFRNLERQEHYVVLWYPNMKFKMALQPLVHAFKNHLKQNKTKLITKH